MLQNAAIDLLVGVFLVCDLNPVDRDVLAGRQMYNSKLSVVSELSMLPLQIVLVILQEDFLGHPVTVGQLEDLCVKVLLLFWDQQRNLRELESLGEHVLSVFRELQA